MKQKRNYKNNKGGGYGDTAMKIGASLALAYVGGYVARGIKKAVTDTKWWKTEVSPWIEKKYNDLEDKRDEAIDSVKEMFNKKD
jgi:hypothetical protein